MLFYGRSSYVGIPARPVSAACLSPRPRSVVDAIAIANLRVWMRTQLAKSHREIARFRCQQRYAPNIAS